MLRSLRARALLEGARGGPRIDFAKVADAVFRISRAALSLGKDLQALEVNPLWCLDDRVEALDALVVTGKEGATAAH
jgi:succinyl-CoA synthetase beta subunit